MTSDEADRLRRMRPRYPKHDSRTRWLGTCIGLTQIRSQKPQLRLFNVVGTLVAMVERRRRVLEICCAKSGDGAPPPRNLGLRGSYNMHHADPVTGFTSAARGKALGHCLLQVSASSSGDQAGLARSPVVVELDRWLGSRTKGYLPLPELGKAGRYWAATTTVMTYTDPPLLRTLRYLHHIITPILYCSTASEPLRGADRSTTELGVDEPSERSSVESYHHDRPLWSCNASLSNEQQGEKED